jgi:hypothetical protein
MNSPPNPLSPPAGGKRGRNSLFINYIPLFTKYYPLYTFNIAREMDYHFNAKELFGKISKGML